jgi:hypothetical protein
MPRTAAVRRSASGSARRLIPVEDEVISPEEARAVEEGRAAFARGDYVTLDELKAHVARQRRQTRSKSRRPVSG